MNICGIDAGGTTTRCILVNENGELLAESKAGPANYQVTGLANVAQEIRKAINVVCKEAGINEIDVLGVGLAGVISKEDIQTVKNNLLLIKQVKKCCITNDGEIAVLGAYAGEPGIVVVVGTGSIIYGLKENGVTVKIGGWGPLLGDEGSGFWIGLKALQAIIKTGEGRNANTSLSSILMNSFNIDDLEELVSFVYQDKLSREKIAALAPLVIRAMADGDQVAKQIIEKGCDELILMITAMAKKINYQKKEIAVTGGLFNNSPFYDLFSYKLKKLSNLKAINPLYPAVYGAILYGALRAGLNLSLKKTE
ncbi:MAG TPA: ROK family protein [Candidatus Atribacteria bacterium]|nr:ROK family protein [Candidatus Atribacteria bacterium]